MGGNASTMAVRAFLEGCRIKIGFPLNREYFVKHFKSNTDQVEVIGGITEINDYHISLNYYISDKIWGLTIPRSNRIFLNRDEDNNKMVSLDNFLDDISDLDIIAIGGTQLPSDYSYFVSKLNKMKDVLSLPENMDKQVHLESSAFNNHTFYETQLDILLTRVVYIDKDQFVRHE